MERLVEAVHLRVFIKPEDDASSVRSAFCRLMPFSIAEEKVDVQEQGVMTDVAEKRTVVVLRSAFGRHRLVRLFVTNLLGMLPKDDIVMLISQLDSRIDDDGCLYLRLGKKDWIDGKAKLTDSGDCFHVCLVIAAYPKNRITVRQCVEKIINPFLGKDG